MSNFPKMTKEETKTVNDVYIELQAVLMRFVGTDLSPAHALTALTLLTVGVAAGSQMPKELIAAEFHKISMAISEGDYDKYINECILLNTPAHSTTMQ